MQNISDLEKPAGRLAGWLSGDFRGLAALLSPPIRRVTPSFNVAPPTHSHRHLAIPLTGTSPDIINYRAAKQYVQPPIW